MFLIKNLGSVYTEQKQISIGTMERDACTCILARHAFLSLFYNGIFPLSPAVPAGNTFCTIHTTGVQRVLNSF